MTGDNQRDARGRFVKGNTVFRDARRDARGRFVKRVSKYGRAARARSHRRERGSRRARTWARWSSDGFPSKRLAEIRAINKAAKKPRFSSYGFRALYHRYVLDEDEADALRAAQQDT